MFKLALAGAFALALSTAALACETVDDVTAMSKKHGGTMDIMEADLLAEFATALATTVPDGATRGIIISGKGGTAYGFEMPDGCLTAPVFIAPHDEPRA